MSKATNAIRLGIDLGSTVFRVAYVHPEDNQALVTVPISIEEFRPCFPIAEHLPINELYASRYFPSLIQRLDRDLDLNFGERVRTTKQVLAELVARTVQAARDYTASEVDGLVFSGPMWLSTEARAAVRAAADATHVAQAEVCTDAQALAAWARAEASLADSSEMMLFFVAGYTGVGVALARSTPRGARILARGGHQGVLAGNCMDFSIMQSAYQVLRQQRIVPTDVAAVNPWIDLQEAAETAKQTVVEGHDAELRFPSALAPEASKHKLIVSASSFAHMVESEMTKAMEIVGEVLEDAGVDPSEVRHVLLSGGTTHIPVVRERLTAHFRQAKLRILPSEAIAFGAARMARQLPPDVGDTAVDAAAGFFYPPIAVEPGLVFLGNAPAAKTENLPTPIANSQSTESPTGPSEDVRPAHRSSAQEEPPIEEMTIAGILRSTQLASEGVEKLRNLELAAARERSKLELAMKTTDRN